MHCYPWRLLWLASHAVSSPIRNGTKPKGGRRSGLIQAISGAGSRGRFSEGSQARAVVMPADGFRRSGCKHGMMLAVDTGQHLVYFSPSRRILSHHVAAAGVDLLALP